MAKTAVDTSVVVAALLSWHEAHPPAFAALSAAAEDGELLLPISALIECYSVLTRLPAAHRLSPGDAAGLLASALQETGRVVGIRTGAAWGFLSALVREDVRGGATYDRRILAEAHAAGAERLLTLNGGDFRRFALDHLEVVVPGEAAR
ncbi:MAG: PIN domain-containing protein [Thermoanaerobaculia bacterium]